MHELIVRCSNTKPENSVSDDEDDDYNGVIKMNYTE